MGYCHVSRQCDDYAHRIGMEEAKEMAFDARVKSSMEIGEEFDPFEVNNFAEGFSEISDKDLAVIGGLMRLEHYEQSAKLMAQHINAYWLKQAEKQMIKET